MKGKANFSKRISLTHAHAHARAPSVCLTKRPRPSNALACWVVRVSSVGTVRATARTHSASTSTWVGHSLLRTRLQRAHSFAFGRSSLACRRLAPLNCERVLLRHVPTITSGSVQQQPREARREHIMTCERGRRTAPAPVRHLCVLPPSGQLQAPCGIYTATSGRCQDCLVHAFQEGPPW
jgi:hypothetical protein